MTQIFPLKLKTADCIHLSRAPPSNVKVNSSQQDKSLNITEDLFSRSRNLSTIVGMFVTHYKSQFQGELFSYKLSFICLCTLPYE